MGEIFLPNNTGGVMYEDAAATVDNVFVVLSGGKKYRRQPDGIFRSSWVVGLTSIGDKTSQMQAIYNHASVTEVVFDSGDVTINGTLTVPAGKKTSFRNNGKLVGSGTLNLKIINADLDQWIFSTTLTVRFTAVSNSANVFSGKWFGAKGDASVNDAPALQKAIDTVIANNLSCKKITIPQGNYITYAPLIGYKYDTSNPDPAFHRYNQFTIDIRGEYEHSGTSGTGTRILFGSNNTFAIGLQQGKRCKITNLSIEGAFAPSFTSDFDFFSRPIATYADGVRRDTVHSPHCGIVVDPFGNRPSVSGKPYFGDEYPGYESWYRGGVNGAGIQAGCTGTRIEDCYVSGFVVGVGHSLNGETKNAEISQIIDCQFAVSKVAIAGGQDQEKCNQAIGIMCWQQIHTVFATGLYGHQTPGNWYVEKLNIAGTVQQLSYNNGQGYYATYYKDIFAERLGRIGYIGTVLGSRVSDSTFDLATPAEAAGYYDYAIDGNNTTYQNCIIRYYGPAIPVAIKGLNHFKGCYFDQPPYVYDHEHGFGSNPTIEQDGMSTFEDCVYDSIRFGKSEDTIISQTTFQNRWVVYGRRKYIDLNRYKQLNEVVEHVIDGGGKVCDVYWARVFNNANACVIDYDSNRTAIVTVGANYVNRFRVGGLVINANNEIVGICNSINVPANQIEIKFVSPSITDGSSHTLGCVYPRYNYGSFIGNTTSGSPTITNVVFDSIGPSGSSCVGNLVEFPIHVNYAFTGGYQRLAKIINYNAGTKTITLDQSIPMTAIGVQLGLGRRTKYVYGATDITDLSDDIILPAGANVNVRPYLTGIERNYIVTRTGFVDAAGIGGGETRQAQWYEVGVAPINRDSFNLVADGNRPVSADKILKSILVKPASSLTALKAGTSAGGEQLVTAQAIASGDWTYFPVGKYFQASGSVYIEGITSSTDIIFVYE
jgi:hypothetical protein